MYTLYSHESAVRFSIEDTLRHPYFWTHQQREYKILELHASRSQVVPLILQSHPKFATWYDAVPPAIKESIDMKGGNPGFGRTLIKFVRDGLMHSKDWAHQKHG